MTLNYMYQESEQTTDICIRFNLEMARDFLLDTENTINMIWNFKLALEVHILKNLKKTSHPLAWNKTDKDVLLFLKMFIRNDDHIIQFKKEKFVHSSLKSRLIPPTFFRFHFEEPLGSAKDRKLLLCLLAKVKTLTSEDYWRNSYCIMFSLDGVDDVSETKVVLERFVSSWFIWFSRRHFLDTPISVNSQHSFRLAVPVVKDVTV